MNRINREEWEQSEWAELKRLRTVFLSEELAHQNKNYWNSSKLLNLYHETFAQRIGWKWDAVLKELIGKNLITENKTFAVLDFGCGTGIAAQKIFEHLGANIISDVWLWDTSKTAVEFAHKKLEQLDPNLKVKQLSQPSVPTGNWILCLSHLINELQLGDLDRLISFIEKADFIIWVEPGTSVSSQRLIMVREKLANKMTIIAPCSHQESCGMLKEANKQHWCHFFALPPKEVFQSAFWNQFSRNLKIDLRSLPVSYLVMGKEPFLAINQVAEARVIGRPRIYKGNGKFLTCKKEGVSETTLLKRNHSQLFKNYKHDIFSQKISGDLY